MSLAQDLMGLGVSPLQAAHSAQGGTGPLTITAAGSSAATATAIGAFQYVSSINANGGSTSGVKLPTVGSDNGCLLADDFVINNAGTTTVTIYASTGVQISGAGINTSAQVFSLHTSWTLYPITTTQWVGVRGS